MAGPVLLGAAVVSAAALLLVGLDPQRASAPGAPPATGQVELVAPGQPGVREPLTVRTRTTPRNEETRPERARGRQALARAEYQARLAALARTPEALEDHARAQLVEGGRLEQQSALLLFLRERRWPSALAWHEQAVRTGATTADASGAGLAEVALGALVAEASHSPEATLALERLAFGADELPAGLRRRAASAFAATSDAAGLLRLEAALARASDPVLVEGCLVALAARPPEAVGTRLLAVHGREPGEPPADVE